MITLSFFMILIIKCSILELVWNALFWIVKYIRLVVSKIGFKSYIFLNLLLWRCKNCSFYRATNENYLGNLFKLLLERSSLIKFLHLMINMNYYLTKLLPDKISIFSFSGFLICFSKIITSFLVYCLFYRFVLFIFNYFI